MQSLGDTNRLPRLIAGSGPGGLGDLRPGRDRVLTSDSLSVGADRPQYHRSHHSASSGRPYGWMALMLIAGCAISLFHLPQTMQGQARGWVDQRAVAAGFAVDHVAVIGHEKTSMSQIADVLDLDTEKSLLGFNGAEVRRKLKRLPWVESVQVVHILPDTVSIRITERLPFAIWQHNGKRFLIDRSGQTLAAHESPRQQEQYPLVVGKGAGVTAGAFLENVTRHPAISNRVRAAVRVADRRWNLVLKSGKKVLLPETGLRTALAMLEALFTDEAMQANSIAMIDLRVPARPTVRLAKSVSKTLRDSKTARRAAAILLAGGAS